MTIATSAVLRGRGAALADGVARGSAETLGSPDSPPSEDVRGEVSFLVRGRMYLGRMSVSDRTCHGGDAVSVRAVGTSTIEARAGGTAGGDGTPSAFASSGGIGSLDSAVELEEVFSSVGGRAPFGGPAATGGTRIDGGDGSGRTAPPIEGEEVVSRMPAPDRGARSGRDEARPSIEVSFDLSAPSGYAFGDKTPFAASSGGSGITLAPDRG